MGALGVRGGSEVSSPDANQMEVARLLRTVGYDKEEHPIIFESNNHLGSLESLLILTYKEVVELEYEFILWRSDCDKSQQRQEPNKAMIAELVDVLVFLRSVTLSTGVNFYLEDRIISVNGQFNGSFDSMKKQIFNLGEGNMARNLELLYTEILSLLKYLDVNLQASTYAQVGEMVNIKLRRNKESHLYQREPGMNEADVWAKYVHVTQALRDLRDIFCKSHGQDVLLYPSITKFFEQEILGWRKSADSLAKLHQKIPLYKEQVRKKLALVKMPRETDEEFGQRAMDKMAWEMTVRPAGSENNSFFQHELIVAGGVPLNINYQLLNKELI